MRALAPVPHRALLAALLLLAAPLTLGAQALSFPPFLELRVPKPPTIGTGDAGAFLAYELHVTNFASQPVTLQSVEVRGGDSSRGVLLTLADTALARRIARPGQTVNIVDRPSIGPGLRAVVFVWVPVDPRTPPAALSHRVTIAQGAGDGARTASLDGPAVPVAREVAVIGPPLRGGPWLAANGPSNESGHRRALIPIDGTPAIAQRFAIDWVKLGDDGKTFTGDRLRNESYHAEGMDALAVADGRVVAVKDGIPENVPGATSRAVPITLETVGGNHVIIDIGGGRYAFYAHLRPGSARVEVGDQVRRGQVIGLVGNSGNSTEPHLHFHISDSPSPLGSEGVPYAIDAFELVGRCKSILGGCESGAASARRGEIPLDNAVVRFP